VSNWEDKSFTALLTSLSPDAHFRGKQFERIAKWWLTQDPIRSLDVKQAWLWDEWPERSGPDIGIDIVAEMFDGTLCAIQAKCFDENRDIPKSELDSFVSAASHRTFQHRWLIATTDRLSANARRMLDDQHVTRIMRSDLEESLDAWPTSVDELNPIQQVKSSPRPHQNLAINDVVKGLASNNRGQLIMACGTGKTLTALWIKETLKPRTTLVLVPSLNLLAQTLSEWAKNTSSPWNYLCVCSDDTVNKADDQPISTVGDLPFDVTTNAEQISDFLSLGGEKIIFSTYQSSSQVAKAQEQSGVSFDLVICDEAHRLTGKTDADYATVLDEKKIVSQKILFMTATPRTYTTAAKSKAEERGVEITSMDDEHIYGPVLHKLSFGEAIKQDLLSDYRVLIVGVTDPQVQDLIDRRELVSVNDAVTTDARTLAAHIGLAKATKDYNLKRTISFHSRIKSADQFARDHAKILEWLPESHKPSGEIWTGTISGAMNTGDRRKLLTQLRLDGEDRHAILTNARCLTEGVDVPSLDGVAFIDPRSSQVDIIQAVGRAIRKSRNKEIGTIVLPVLIPTDVDAENAIEDTSFKPIWAVLNALKSHDEDFSHQLNDLRTELGRTGKLSNLPSRLVEDLPSELDSKFPNFIHQLSLAVLEQTSSSWNHWYGMLQRFQIENGHCRVVRPRNRKGPKTTTDVFAGWVNTQRSLFATGGLSQERIDSLNAVPGWIWSIQDEQWEFAIDLLSGFIHREGHSQVPQQHIESDFKLGLWASNLRARYPNLIPDRIEFLESLPGWSWDPKEDHWQQRFKELEEYSRLHGTALVSRQGAGSLGSWIESQRNSRNRGNLPVDKIELLENLPNWSWHTKKDAWQKGFDYLFAYSEVHGTCNVPLNFEVDGFALGRWFRKQYSRIDEYSIDRQKLLRELPGWTEEPLVQLWESRFELLIKFVRREGTSAVPKNHLEDDFALGNWIGTQRSMKKRNSLDPTRAARLERLPGWLWNPLQDKWETKFEALQQFAITTGNSMPARNQIYNEVEIGSFAYIQRGKKKNLSPKRKRLLESLPGWSWSVTEADWNYGYSVLQEYVREFGSSDVPQSKTFHNFKLGGWVSSQRNRFRKNTIPNDQIRQLEMEPGWSWMPADEKRISNFLLGIAALQTYVERTGTTEIKREHLEDEFPLGRWLSNIRTRYKAGSLNQHEIEAFDSIQGWDWSPLQAAWNANFRDVLLYCTSTGSSDIPYDLVIDGRSVGVWASSQRAKFRRGKLEVERVQKFSQIPNWTWDKRQSGPRINENQN
jgi:superfamily II DNA or RNA helicase